MSSPDFQKLSLEAGSVFTPGAPVNEQDLFAGRLDQFDKVLDATSQRGYHAVLYGERGVGKTSLSNMISAFLINRGKWIVPRVNCDASDDFSSLWKKALRDIAITKTQPGIGFGSKSTTSQYSYLEHLPSDVTPDEVRRCLAQLSAGAILLIIFDEFDRIADKNVTSLMADTIKMLSDYNVGATIMLIGVADSVDELIAGHQSIERGLVQIPMPRMSQDEIRQIVSKGSARLGMAVDLSAMDEIASLSQGLPYITHLIALHSTRVALRSQSMELRETDVQQGIQQALSQWQQSIKTSYYVATKSHQPDNIYQQVLLACGRFEEHSSAVPDVIRFC
jgi:Cdc6-like AAA superfamily ATPase